jgi:hypothetical protein
VQRAIRQKRPVVFVGWEPHPMNIQMQIAYLTGGDAYFGPNFGEARVNTLVANDYMERCPNAGKLLTNLVFSTDIENRLMVPIMGKVLPATAAKDFLKQNPDLLPKWLAGVKTIDGQDGCPPCARRSASDISIQGDILEPRSHRDLRRHRRGRYGQPPPRHSRDPEADRRGRRRSRQGRRHGGPLPCARPRNRQGQPRPALYRELVDRIRSSSVDMVLNLTAGMGGDLEIGPGETPMQFGPGTDLVGGLSA